MSRPWVKSSSVLSRRLIDSAYWLDLFVDASSRLVMDSISFASSRVNSIVTESWETVTVLMARCVP